MLAAECRNRINTAHVIDNETDFSADDERSENDEPLDTNDESDGLIDHATVCSDADTDVSIQAPDEYEAGTALRKGGAPDLYSR
jgi:hypothetical protein